MLVAEVHRTTRTALGEAVRRTQHTCEGASAVVAGNTARRADGPTRGTDSTSHHAPIVKRRGDCEARVLSNKTVSD